VVAAHKQAAEFIRAPHDEREGRRDGELAGRQRCRAEDAVQRGNVDQSGGERQRERDTAEQVPLVKIPTERNEAWSVRIANAVPTWQATIPSQATVVA
jgi:hypothetical protein